jgi:hypothetical protein
MWQNMHLKLGVFHNGINWTEVSRKIFILTGFPENVFLSGDIQAESFVISSVAVAKKCGVQ